MVKYRLRKRERGVDCKQRGVEREKVDCKGRGVNDERLTVKRKMQIETCK